VAALDEVTNLTEESLVQLQRFVQMLDRWRKVTNLISKESFAEVWERHVQDSVKLQRFADFANNWLDFGSGAGFPGIVIGVLLAPRRGARVHCVESDGRKCAFLRAVVAELNIPVKVHHERAERISLCSTGPVDVVTARAFSSIATVLALADDYLAGGTVAVLPRGQSWAAEVETINLARYAVDVRSDPVRAKGAILSVRRRG
jgi:16S rRNA (guanine527-N7)-methyltransferase